MDKALEKLHKLGEFDRNMRSGRLEIYSDWSGCIMDGKNWEVAGFVGIKELNSILNRLLDEQKEK